jgi:hypothetical protein
LFDAVHELVRVDRAGEKSARDPLEFGMGFVARVRRSADEQDIDGTTAGCDLHASHGLERAWGIRITDHERRSLHRHASREQSERNVDHPVAAAAKCSIHALSLGRRVAHENERAGSAWRATRTVGARLGVGAHHLGDFERTPLPVDSPLGKPEIERQLKKITLR